MKKLYTVREYFVSPILGPMYGGQNVQEYLLAYLTPVERSKLDVKELSTDFSVFGYGLIFYSTEMPFPEEIPDETYEEMQCRILNEMNECCPPGNNKPFLNEETNGETD